MLFESFLVDVMMLMLRDNLLHDLVENYAEITPKLHAKETRRPKLAAARSAAANFVRRLCRVFCVQLWRNFGVMFNQIVQ